MPDALRRAGAIVITHHQKFAPGTPDAVWLAALAEHPDWIVITKDSQIRRRPLEREAYKNSRARVFTLTCANLTGQQQAEALVRALPKIRRLSKRQGPFIARVTAAGAVEILKFK